ncbi:small glutamine-rich tetratricopeptide repeat-containing protein 2 [Podospora aff. communis PSN243]|uniref:Small glutamine-rich tetratricopeptide repeat-containing protein 2 n=1 Tax=Podospora aff. communis PSN243 TaxID=3040156 RepID=A0AAV9GU63_9PEZI|nr:small glutamine-rich tetratricopeptide repeat-containing protein 2 [Podospora aff. communis PSN243]
MTDVAGLVIGVAALWKTCVQVYEIVDSSRQFGMESEILSVKFEVERVRLICWGDVIGLQSLVSGENPAPTALADPRLNRAEIRTAVVRLLGCIQHSFENTSRLQDQYGLQPSTVAPDAGPSLTVSQTDRILSSVFKRAYDNLRRVAGDRQRDTPLTRRTIWAIRDRNKFLALVAELRGFNDSLESLFPDARAKAAEAMRNDIEAADGIRELQLLQEATAGENNGVSECASVRLEALGVTVSARTELLSATKSVADSEATVERGLVKADEEADEEIPRADEGGQKEPEMSELEKRFANLEVFVAKKNRGALSTYVSGPYSRMSHVSAHVYWDGDRVDNSPSPWDERDKGFVPVSHAAFEMFKKRKYISKRGRGQYETLDSEDYCLFDPESHAKYENINPGTVTVEGFGLECWDYEETKPRKTTFMVNRSELPVLPARRLLRRLHDIQKNSGKFGWNPTAEELNLKETVGSLGIVYYDQKYAQDRNRWIGDLYHLLNRDDILANFVSESSVGLQWAATGNDSIGLWNFLRQIIIGWELMVRLENLDGGRSYTGFNERILATLIVSDLWLKHVEIVLAEQKIGVKELKKAETPEEKAKAEDFKNKGNEALKKGEFQKAVDLYTEAITIDLTNAIYRCNRAAALLELERWEDAEEDAYITTHLDPKYPKAWSRLGLAILKQGHAKRAKKAFEKALELAGREATPQMRKGLADADEKIKEQVKAINTETDKTKQHALISEHHDQDWEIVGKSPELHSLVHERQVEGLLYFAERMKWPYINEVRDYAEDAYSTIRGGGTINIHLHDWLFGLILPGKWFSFKIMTALILCTQSIVKKVGIAHYYESGLYLPTRSYWRQRSVLGRVLGCLPGVISLCGWIGPCPRVEIEPAPEDPSKPRHIRVKTRRVATSEHKSDSDDGVIHIGGTRDREEGTRIRPDEEIDPYLADMKDTSQWIVPAPPVRDISTCTIESIKLTKLALRTDVSRRAATSDADELDIENETEYRASIVFKRDDNADPITYKLFTNPVFVTVPPCRPGPKGPHEVHMRELHSFQNVWDVERLKDHTPEDLEGGRVMVINATGKGAEVLARAWCSERGKNAVVRRKGGPCFVCAVRAAGKAGLGTGVLIWSDE